MKKYLYPLAYVLLHALSVVVLIYICIFVLKLSILDNLKIITFFVLVICSLEWVLLGFISNVKLKYKPKEIIITTIIILILLYTINLLHMNLYVLPIDMIHMFSFTGLFMISLTRENILGEYGILVYAVYYTLLFIIGIFANKKIDKLINNG